MTPYQTIDMGLDRILHRLDMMQWVLGWSLFSGVMLAAVILFLLNEYNRDQS